MIITALDIMKQVTPYAHPDHGLIVRNEVRSCQLVCVLIFLLGNVYLGNVYDCTVSVVLMIFPHSFLFVVGLWSWYE